MEIVSKDKFSAKSIIRRTVHIFHVPGTMTPPKSFTAYYNSRIVITKSHFNA